MPLCKGQILSWVNHHSSINFCANLHKPGFRLNIHSEEIKKENLFWGSVLEGESWFSLKSLNALLVFHVANSVHFTIDVWRKMPRINEKSARFLMMINTHDADIAEIRIQNVRDWLF